MDDWTLEEAFLIEEKISSLQREDIVRLFDSLGIKLNSENVHHEVIRLFHEVPKSALMLELKNFGIKI